MAGDSATREVTVAQLQKTRAAHKGHLTKLEVHIADHETGVNLLNEVSCKNLIAKVQTIEVKVCDVNEHIYELTSAGDMEAAVSDAYDIERRITNMFDRLHEIQNNFPPSAPSSAVPHSASSAQFIVPQVNHVKLPTFDLPKFSGAFEDWLNFDL